MSISTMSMLQRFRPAMVAKAQAMHDQGESLDAIARYLTAKSGILVGRETVRMHFKRTARPETSVEAATEVAP